MKNVVKRREPGSGVKQVQGRGTNGNEGDIHPGSNLKRVHLRLGSVHNLQYFTLGFRAKHKMKYKARKQDHVLQNPRKFEVPTFPGM